MRALVSDISGVETNDLYIVGQITGQPAGGGGNTRIGVATIDNRIANGRSQSSGKNRRSFYEKHLIAADCTEIYVTFDGFYTTNTGQSNLGNDYAVESACIINNATNATTPVYWSGSRSKTIINGSTVNRSDAIPASAFGLTKFSKGQYIWVKGILSATSGGYFPTCVKTPGDISGQQAWYYDSAVTTLSTVDASGPFTVASGTAATSTSTVHGVKILGTYVDPSQKSYIVIGDSLGEGRFDSSRGIFGRGSIQVAMAGNQIDIFPCLNFARDAAVQATFTGSNTKWMDYLQYATIFMDQIGANDIVNGRTASSINADTVAIWDNLKTNYGYTSSRIVKVGVAGAASSTDSFVTYGNQTVAGIATQAFAYTDLMEAHVTNGNILGFYRGNEVRDPAGTGKWLVDGVTPLLIPQTDTIHMQPYGQTIFGSGIKANTMGGATYPIAWPAGWWSVADAALGGTLTVTLSIVPYNAGSAITDIQYRVNSGSWVSSGRTTAGTFNITGLSDNVSATVKIRSVNAIGAGPTSLTTKSATPTPAVTVPSAFTSGQWSLSDPASSGNLAVSISALPSNGGSSITALQYELDGSGTWTSFSGTTTGTYTISGLVNNQAYNVRIRAVNSVGNGSASDTKSATPTAAATAPAAFTSGQWTLSNPATAGDLKISISALPSNGGSSITDLQYELDASGTWTSLSGTTTGDYTISGLTDNQAYNVRIRAVNAVGNGSASDTKSATPTASYTPADSGTLLAWWDASDSSTVTASGGDASDITDKSGNGYTLSGPSNKPAYGSRTQNGLNVLDFSGTDKLQTTTATGLLSGIGSANHTIFVVGAVDNSTQIHSFSVGQVSGNSTRHLTQYNSGPVFIGQLGTSGVNMSVTLDFNCHIVGYNRTSTTSLFPFRDGTKGTAGTASNQTLINFSLGDRVSSSFNPLDGFIGEVIIYAESLSDAKCNEVGNYLAAKWGVTWTNF